eukprot:m.255295 g.255295  ORF g.255295 m.255295 type:complete len:147 (-) comp15945_c0_seq3:3060-3500(-)
MLQALALGLVWVVAGSAGAPAGSKEGSILCRGSAASFQATMSTAGWAPGSGFFNLVDASIMDNYNGGKLTCMGSKLGQEINCVGFNKLVSTHHCHQHCVPDVLLSRCAVPAVVLCGNGADKRSNLTTLPDAPLPTPFYCGRRGRRE